MIRTPAWNAYRFFLKERKAGVAHERAWDRAVFAFDLSGDELQGFALLVDG